MYLRTSIVIATALCTYVAFGDITIREWSGISGSKYQVTYPIPNDPNTVNITILESDTGTFSFEAFYTGTNSAAHINLIETDPSGVTGTVRLKIASDPSSARVYGAADVRELDLSTAGTGVLSGLNISGDLGETAGVECDDVIDDVSIGGNVLNTFDAGDVDSGATITIAKDLEGTLTANTLGNLTINGDSNLIAVPGDIEIAQDFDGTITINNKFAGTIQIGDPGTTLSNLGGTIAIVGNFQSPAEIIVAGGTQRR